MTGMNERVKAGQAVYTRTTLAVYDTVVLGISNRFLWKCSSRRLLDHYDRHVSANHLDIGVGTGYFLDRCRFPVPAPWITLMDLNPASLTYAARRIARYKPQTLLRNVLEPFSPEGRLFDSVGINYLLHCVPGSIHEKASVFDHIKAVMKPGAVVFGSTLLQGGVQPNWPARRLMAVYNQKGVFSNTLDDLAGLKEELDLRFRHVDVQIKGCAALFAARV